MRVNKRTAEIPSLTGLRGVAACLVVFFHYFQDVTGLGPAHLIFAHGYIAVDLFFVLSGFVMALTYGTAFAGSFSVVAFAGFLGKRLGRVYPLYVVVTAVVAALSYTHTIDGEPLSAGTIASNAAMVQAWGFTPSIAGTTWSISTEFAAYLVFPVLVSLTLTGRASVCWLVSAASVATVFALCHLDTATLHQVWNGVVNRSGPLDVYGDGTLYPLLRCFAGFVLGLATFRAYSDPRWRRVCSWRHAGDLAALVVIVLLAIPGSDAWLELAFVVLVITLASGTSRTSAVMSWGPVFWLGEVSYSIYLVHRLVSDVIRNPVAAMLNRHHVGHAYTLSGLPPLVLTVMVSAATFYLIEKPARNLSRRLMGSKRVPSIASEPAAP